jgi:tetratricopeptide (TPR) repeat protein
LDNIAQVRSDVAWVHTETGKVYLSHGDFSTGEEHLRRALELDENHVAGHRALAWLYEQQGQLEQAVHLLRSLAERVPDDLALLLNLGELCVRMAWFKEAEDAYRKAIESTPHNPGGYVALAGLHLKTGAHPAEARQLAEQAVSLDPRPSSYALLSAACQQCGDQTAALAAIDQALELEPGNPEYLALRATIRK